MDQELRERKLRQQIHAIRVKKFHWPLDAFKFIMNGMGYGDSLSALSEDKLLEFKAKAKLPLRFHVRLEVGDGGQKPSATAAAELNKLLVTLKHAFEDKNNALLIVKLWEKDGRLMLQVKDNGKGYNPENVAEGRKSFGQKLIKSLSDKLEADVLVDTVSGAEITLSIKDYKKAS